MATHEDAALMMDIMTWHTAAGGMDAAEAILSPDFDPDTAVASDRHVFVMLMMGETIGTFTKHGLLDTELVDDLWATEMVWARVGPAALRDREKFGEPRLWENFEALASS
jgi:hypothetical protein